MINTVYTVWNFALTVYTYCHLGHEEHSNNSIHNILSRWLLSFTGLFIFFFKQMFESSTAIILSVQCNNTQGKLLIYTQPEHKDWTSEEHQRGDTKMIHRRYIDKHSKQEIRKQVVVNIRQGALVCLQPTVRSPVNIIFFGLSMCLCISCFKHGFMVYYSVFLAIGS